MNRPEEVSMHPSMTMALANEVVRERQNERNERQLRSQILADRTHVSNGARAASRLARRLVAGVSLRQRLS